MVKAAAEADMEAAAAAAQFSSFVNLISTLYKFEMEYYSCCLSLRCIRLHM